VTFFEANGGLKMKMSEEAMRQQRRAEEAIELTDAYLSRTVKVIDARFGAGYASANPTLLLELISLATRLETILMPDDEPAALERDAPLRR